MATFKPAVDGITEVVITCDPRFRGVATVSWRERTKKKRTVKIAAQLLRSLCAPPPVVVEQPKPTVAAVPPSDQVLPGETTEVEDLDDDLEDDHDASGDDAVDDTVVG